MKNSTLLFFLFLLCCLNSFSQDTNKMIQSANDLYKEQQYEKAELAYDKVLERDRYNVTAKFNQANTYFRRSKKDDAVKAFDYLTSDGRDKNLREKAFYNKGVVLSRQEKLEESIEAYKSSLRLNPSDTMARENLQKAMLDLKKKQPPPKKEDEKKKKDPDQQKKQKQQPQPKMNQKEAEQRLKMMEQKEKEVLQRMQSEKSKAGNTVAKDW
ncbi:MAG: tetratricopeptide repeat protein [Chitinophagaceae bacterium]|nr:tetratricopeptide repeat protein [Chitinophagaceae bacterium]